MTRDVIYLDLDDEITSVIDKLENANKKEVALVLPKRAAFLQSIVNMRLLQRAAEDAGKNVVLITNESAILPLAGAAGLQVAKNLQSPPYTPPSPVPVKEPDRALSSADQAAEEADETANDDASAKIDYSRSIGELAAGHEVEEPEEPIAAKPTAPKDKRLRVPNFDKFRLMLGLSVLAVMALTIFMLLAITILPKAKATIKTSSLPLSANFALTTDGAAKSLNEEKAIIPAVLQTKDQTATQTVNATGQQNNGEKASGSVTMSAGACGPSVPADIPAGAGLSSSSLTYITQTKTSFAPVVSGGKCTFQSTSSTPIKAQIGGSKYNVNSATFSVAGYPSVTASGSASGGTDNIATILSQADIDGAKQKITSSDTDKFAEEFKKSLTEKEDIYLITPTLKLSEPEATATPAVGQPATTAAVTVKITHSVLTVKKNDLKKVITTQLNKQIDSQKQKLVDEDVASGLSVSVQSQTSSNNMTLQISKDTSAVPVIDVESLKKQITGLKSAKIRETISSIPGVKEVDVKMSPFWVAKAPKPSKITVVQEHVKDSGSISP